MKGTGKSSRCRSNLSGSAATDPTRLYASTASASIGSWKGRAFRESPHGFFLAITTSAYGQNGDAGRMTRALRPRN